MAKPFSPVVLKRSPVVVHGSDENSGDDFNPFVDLALESEELLGYSLLKKNSNVYGNDLGQALRKVGVEPFDLQSVDHYKDVMSKPKWFNALLSAVVGFVACPPITLFMFLGGLMMPLFSGVTGLTLIDKLALTIGGLTLMIGSILVFVVVYKRLDGRVDYDPHWERIPIKDYSRPIPEFVLDTAIGLTKVLPGCQLYVEEFVEWETIKDPFLLVIHGSDMAYLEVWNEPGFNNRREF